MFNLNAITDELTKAAEPFLSRLDRIIKLLESINQKVEDGNVSH